MVSRVKDSSNPLLWTPGRLSLGFPGSLFMLILSKFNKNVKNERMVLNMSTKDLIKASAILYIVIVLMFVLTAPAFAQATIYARVGVVVEINRVENYYLIEDAAGFLWEDEDPEDFVEGDVVVMMLADIEKTNEILDDAILSVEATGFFETDFE